MKIHRIAFAAVLTVAASANSSGNGVYIDPASRWESIHDPKGSSAPGDFAIDMQKACPSVPLSSDRESARYVVTFNRTNANAGSLLIYSDGSVVLAKKPGHSATLRKVAVEVCSFVSAAKQ